MVSQLKIQILVCGMASSDRRGKLKIETCLKSDRLEIVVHEAEGLRNDFDESELKKMFGPIRTRKNIYESPMDVNGLSDPYIKGTQTY